MKTIKLLLLLFTMVSVVSCINTGKSKSEAGDTSQNREENDTFKIHIAKWPNGNIQKKTEAINVGTEGKAKWIPHGKQWVYYEKGPLQAVFNYDRGKYEGIATYFYGDGKTLYRELPYANGKKEGVVKKYYRSGRLQSETPYKSDMLGTGSLDYADRDEDAALTMPTIKVWADDQRRAKGTYTIYAKVVDKYDKTVKQVKFLEGMLLSADGRKYEHPGLIELKLSNGVGSKTYYESQGFPEFISISARFTTSKGTAVLLNKVHTIN